MKVTLAKLLAVLLILITSSGCAPVVLYPIEKQDIVIMKKGEAYTPDRDGLFLSNLYVEKVAQARVSK